MYQNMDDTITIIIIIIIIIESFSHQRQFMVFNWSLIDSKSPQVSSTLLRILTDLNNAVDWTVSLFPCPSVLVPILWWLYQEHQLQLV